VHEQLLDMHFFAPLYSAEEILVGKISSRIVRMQQLTIIRSLLWCSKIYQD